MGEWRPPSEAQVDGTICDLRFRCPLGVYDAPGDYFLHDDGFWYRLEPPLRVKGRVHSWRAKAPPQ